EDVPELPGLTMQYMEIDTGTSQFDLTLSITDDEDGLAGSIEYSTELFDEARIGRLAEHLTTLLRAVATDPECRISSLPLLPPGERSTILMEWSGAGTVEAATEGREPIEI